MKRFFSKLDFRNTRIFAILVGLAATIWFLLRVIPKPSRATYPCMRIAAPFMSTFVIYLLGLSVSVFSFKKFRSSVRSAKYLVASVSLGMIFLSFSFLIMKDNNISFANSLKNVDSTFPVASNSPIGTARGMFPGRVVWIHNPDATRKAYNPDTAGSDWWLSATNTDLAVVKEMLANSMKTYAGKEDLTEAWDAIFKGYNSAHNRGDVGYTAGEKIAIKINLTNAGSNMNAKRMNATPQLGVALLDQLINVVGVAPEDITFGDPYRDFSTHYRSQIASVFPDVNYTDGDGGTGVSQTVPSSEGVLKFSYNSNGVDDSSLPQHYLDATYFINMPCLKTHNDGGITLIAKNHQGSFLEPGDDPKDQFAIKMHDYLPTSSHGSGKYRHIVDYMSHESTGGKGLIYIIDGIWGGVSWEGWITKYYSEPFGIDYPNSLFVGQDPVALESVCFDILFNEYDVDDDKPNYPIDLKDEIADGLKQMASSDYWPAGVDYDPEGDGTNIESQGVFEHWNNAKDRQYTRNLGTGDGIELIYKGPAVAVENIKNAAEVRVGPNPFSDYTVFTRPASFSDNSNLTIYNMNGQIMNQVEFDGSDKLTWKGVDARGASLSNGVYLYTVTDLQRGDQSSGKIVINR